MDEAIVHCTRGLGIWDWASTEEPGQEPEMVLACAGDIPTIEVLAAAKILRKEVTGLRVRMLDDSDRYHLVMDVIDRVAGLGIRHAALRQRMVDSRLRARAHAYERGEDAPHISGWQWDEGGGGAPGGAPAETGGDNG